MIEAKIKAQCLALLAFVGVLPRCHDAFLIPKPNGVSLQYVSTSTISKTTTQQQRHSTMLFETKAKNTVQPVDTGAILSEYDQAFRTVSNEITKTCKVKVASVDDGANGRRFGLVATQPISKGETVLAIPYDDRYEFTATLAKKVVYNDVLPSDYDGWTGDAGLIALLLLNEVARASSGDAKILGTDIPKRSATMQAFIEAWVRALPSPLEMDHPLLWSEEDQEILQMSSTNKIYRKLDDIEEDVIWLTENVFDKDRKRFPESASWNGMDIPCFSLAGFRWAMACVQSRAFFVDGSLRLMPIFDMCNHADKCEEVRSGTMGAFGTVKGAQLVAAQEYKAGEEVFCSYGPKSAADYLLEHGFCPPASLKTAVAELTFEIDPEDRFRDDKYDILEFETYDQAPMNPVQSFDVVSAPGRDGEPDPALMQFLRLCKLGATDAFLLESIFRKEVWGFMELPVSEQNELDVVNTIIEASQRELDGFKACPKGGRIECAQLRESETKALSKTIDFLKRDREALDLKEYYQERRLKSLGLDSDWSPEENINPDGGFGRTREPGDADFDW